MKTVLKYLSPFYGAMSRGFVIKLIGTLAELMLPYILSHILKNVIGKNISDILLWGGLMVVFSAFS